MRRRELIILLGGGAVAVAVAVPIGGRAQQPTGMRRVGVLMNLSENDPEAQRLVTVIREGLAPMAADLRIDYRWAGGDAGRVRAFAKELVELSPDIIVGYATPSVVALHRRPARSPSCSCRSPTRLAKVLSRAWHIRAAI
jgi:putative tryptophan/tyrosine transport system substrate-binding protein